MGRPAKIQQRALNRMGWDFGAPRLPVHPLSAEHATQVDQVCHALGLY